MILFMGIPLEQNDHDFMEALYLRYIALMRYAAMKYDISRQDAEDAIHDTMMKLCRHIPKLRGMNDNRLATYIVISVGNSVKDLLRKRHPEHYAEEAEVASIADEGPAVEEQAIERMTVAAMMEAIQKMPDKLREIIRLHDLVGWKDWEIGELMGLSPASVRVYLRKARKQLGLSMMKDMKEEREDG